MKELPNLYALRFILSIFVVITHIPLVSKTLNIASFNDHPIFHKGTLSVFYFFTLSGFLIIRLLWLELRKNNTINLKRFYARRISRLYPVYYLVLFVGLFIYHFMLPLFNIDFEINYSLDKLLLYFIFFMPNVFTSFYSVGGILEVLWSIGVEEQFYLFIPLLILTFKGKTIKLLSVVLIICLILFAFTNAFVHYNFYFYFLFGGLLAIIFEQMKTSIFNNKIVHLIVYAVFILSFVTNIFDFENRFLFHFFNMIVSGLLISLISYYPVFNIESKIINHLGKVSYGIYMYHMIVLTGILFLVTKFSLESYFISEILFICSLNIAVIFTTIAVASVSFKYFESIFYKSKLVSKSKKNN
ncbi:acyltransferase family protein [Maribacter aestuarii]|uniref:acyltransferase family protein n=1 Tax=Maribacter aestuarii TaxID=1130723 RepID=UPI0025A4FC86|nr:acyltransferase [Maribacter aestuarii]